MKIYRIAQSSAPFSSKAYHGTIFDFNSFDQSQIGVANDFGTLGRGFYFTLDPNVAQSYARSAYKRFQGDKSSLIPQIITVNINLQNALNSQQRTMRTNYQGETPAEQANNMTQNLTSQNIDGVLLYQGADISEIIVYDPSKISIVSKTPVDVSDLNQSNKRRLY